MPAIPGFSLSAPPESATREQLIEYAAVAGAMAALGPTETMLRILVAYDSRWERCSHGVLLSDRCEECRREHPEWLPPER